MWTMFSWWLPAVGARTGERIAPGEIAIGYPTQAAAEYAGMHTACLAHVCYVSVQGPDDVVTAEFDRYTNRWREYGPARPRVRVRVDPAAPGGIRVDPAAAAGGAG